MSHTDMGTGGRPESPSREVGAELTLFTGRFGSGKSEAAISYVTTLGVRGLNTPILIDLDIVTPYFRSREAAEMLAQHGVKVIAPASVGLHLDTPAITPQILGAIEQTEAPTVLDVGGDRQGARALGGFSAAIQRRGYTMHFVVNPFRPFTSSLDGLARSIAEIEASSRLKVTDLVSNPNLMAETTAEVIIEGHAKVEAFAREVGLPVAMVCLERKWTAPGFDHFAQPVLVLDRFLLHLWESDR